MIPMLPTPNFRFSEFDGKGELATLLNNLAATAEMFQKLRDLVGVPIRITNGYRSPEENDRVKGDKVSRHLTAQAGDGILMGMTLFDFYLRIQESELDFSNLILYPFDKGHFHIELPETRARRKTFVKRAGANVYDPITKKLLEKFPGAHPIVKGTVAS